MLYIYVEIGKCFDMDENKTIAYQNLWNVAKTVLRGKFRAISAYIKKRRKISSQPNLLL